MPMLMASEALSLSSPTSVVRDGVCSDEQMLQKRHGFFVGEIGVLIPEETEAQLVENMPFCHLRTKQNWFLGIVGFHGLMVPLFDLSIMINSKHLKIEQSKILIIGSKDKSIGVLVESNPTKLTLHENQAVSLDLQFPELLGRSVSKMYKADSIWIEMYWENLFTNLGEVIAVS